MRILIVEDEEKMAKALRQGLEAEQYSVSVAHSGEEGFFLASTDTPDLVILDLMLPQRDGMEVLAALRQKGLSIPVLILTSKDTLEDRVRGLDVGADDYLVKPFAFPELVARLRALLRRPPLQMEPILRFGDLAMDTARREVRRGGRLIELSPREFTLLEYLMRHPRHVLTRTQLAEHVWNFDFFSDSNVVDVYIGYLRRKIDRGFDRPLLQTVRGVGYRLSDAPDEA